MADAVHDRHWRLAIPRVIIASQDLPSRFQPAPEFFAEVISPRELSKNCWRTTVAEPIWENASETALVGDHGRLFRPRSGRLERTCRRGVAGFIEAAIGRDSPLVLVGHDWGSALGFDWANQPGHYPSATSRQRSCA
jgi:hypothetical protein